MLHYDAVTIDDADHPAALRQCHGSTALDHSAGVAAGLGRAAELIESSHAPATVAAYRLDMAAWYAWAELCGVVAWPIAPAALFAYIGHLETTGKSVATIARRCAAISRLHRDHGMASPTIDPMIARLLRGLRREHSGEKSPKRAFTPDLVRAFMAEPSTSIRDRALVAVAFVTGLRRSELVALDWTDVADCPDSGGLVLHVRSSKTDQTGAGAYVAIPRATGPACPVRAVLAWRAVGANGRVFPISTSTVLRVAKRIAVLAGLDPADYGAHSLRAGMCTTAARAGVSLAESMQASRHTSADVAASYVRPVAATENRAHQAAARALAGE